MQNLPNASPELDNLSLDELYHTLIRKINFVDSLVRMGEEPHRFSCYVKELIEIATKAFLRAPPEQFVGNDLDPFVFVFETYINFIYLAQYPKKMYVLRAGKKAKKDYLQMVCAELNMTNPYIRSMIGMQAGVVQEFFEKIKCIATQ